MIPGWTEKCSIPAIRKRKANRSGSDDASISVPREVLGARGFAIRATPKCPMNIVVLAAILPRFADACHPGVKSDVNLISLERLTEAVEYDL